MMKELEYSMPAGQDLVNIAGATDRYALYKVGPVLAASVSWYIVHVFLGIVRSSS